MFEWVSLLISTGVELILGFSEMEELFFTIFVTSEVDGLVEGAGAWLHSTSLPSTKHFLAGTCAVDESADGELVLEVVDV